MLAGAACQWRLRAPCGDANRTLEGSPREPSPCAEGSTRGAAGPRVSPGHSGGPAPLEPPYGFETRSQYCLCATRRTRRPARVSNTPQIPGCSRTGPRNPLPSAALPPRPAGAALCTAPASSQTGGRLRPAPRARACACTSKKVQVLDLRPGSARTLCRSVLQRWGNLLAARGALADPGAFRGQTWAGSAPGRGDG